MTNNTIGSKLFLLINYTFYSNLNSTNFSCYLCGTHLIDRKLFLLINYSFYSKLIFHVIYVEFLHLFIACKLFLLINYTFYSNLNSTKFFITGSKFILTNQQYFLQ